MKKYEIVYRNEFEADSEEQARALALQDIEVEMSALQVYELGANPITPEQGIANVCADLIGTPLSQAEVDTLLSAKTGGMFSDGAVSMDSYGANDD